MKKDVTINTSTWNGQTQPTLKLEIWTKTQITDKHYEKLGMGYLRDMEKEYMKIPEGLKKLVVQFFTLDYLENGLDWNDPMLLEYLK